jgi:hypothetical protein
MEDPLGLHPMSSRRQGALFERNPVCALCYRICMHICDEQGGINFQLIRCLEEADRLCEEIVLNPWELEGIEEYYHKMERRLDSCQISLSCAFATVCVTLNCMTNLPEPVYQLAHDLRGLIIGEGNNLYNNLQQSACRKDIRMSGFMYGDIPPIPKEVLELAELKDSNAQLTKEVIYYKQKIHTMEEEKKVKNIGYNVEQMTINMSGGTLVQHADLVQASGEVVVEKPSKVSNQCLEGSGQTTICAYLVPEKIAEIGICTMEQAEAELKAESEKDAKHFAAYLRKKEKAGIIYFHGDNKKQILASLQAHFPNMKRYTYNNFIAYF